MTYRFVIVLLVACLCSTAPAWAQDEPPPRVVATGEPVSLTIAVFGTVIMTAGFGLMLQTTSPCSCEPRPEWVVGGAVVVVAGVVVTWLGLRERKVTIAPMIDKHTVGGMARVRWGQ